MGGLLEYLDNGGFEWSVEGEVMEGEVEGMLKLRGWGGGE